VRKCGPNIPAHRAVSYDIEQHPELTFVGRCSSTIVSIAVHLTLPAPPAPSPCS